MWILYEQDRRWGKEQFTWGLRFKMDSDSSTHSYLLWHYEAKTLRLYLLHIWKKKNNKLCGSKQTTHLHRKWQWTYRLTFLYGFRTNYRVHIFNHDSYEQYNLDITCWAGVKCNRVRSQCTAWCIFSLRFGWI